MKEVKSSIQKIEHMIGKHTFSTIGSFHRWECLQQKCSDSCKVYGLKGNKH